MKEKYIKPELTIDDYKTVDVISTSSKIGTDEDGWIDKWY